MAANVPPPKKSQREAPPALEATPIINLDKKLRQNSKHSISR